MPQQLSSFLLGLLLVVAAACSQKKNTPEPKPSLDGSWQQTHVRVVTSYDDNRPISDSGKQAYGGTLIYAFSGNTLTTTIGGTQYPYTYTRNGDVLTMTSTSVPPASNPSEMRILELTATTLVLEKQPYRNATGTAVSTAYFTRQ